MKRTSIKRKASRYAAKDSHWRHDVLARDDYRFAIDSTYADDAHHIASKGAWPALRHEVTNGISLSRARHRWAHDHPAAFKAWLQVARPEQWAEVEALKRADNHSTIVQARR